MIPYRLGHLHNSSKPRNPAHPPVGAIRITRTIVASCTMLANRAIMATHLVLAPCMILVGSQS